MLNYLLENWIAIVALSISLVSLVRGIIARDESRQVQLEEKNYALRNKYFSIINEMELSIFELSLFQVKFEKIKKRLTERNSNSISPKLVYALKFLKFIQGTIEEQITAYEKIKPEYENLFDESLQKNKQSLVELAKSIEHINNLDKISITNKERLSRLLSDLEILMDEGEL